MQGFLRPEPYLGRASPEAPPRRTRSAAPLPCAPKEPVDSGSRTDARNHGYFSAIPRGRQGLGASGQLVFEGQAARLRRDENGFQLGFGELRVSSIRNSAGVRVRSDGGRSRGCGWAPNARSRVSPRHPSTGSASSPTRRSLSLRAARFSTVLARGGFASCPRHEKGVEGAVPLICFAVLQRSRHE